MARNSYDPATGMYIDANGQPTNDPGSDDATAPTDPGADPGADAGDLASLRRRPALPRPTNTGADPTDSADTTTDSGGQNNQDQLYKTLNQLLTAQQANYADQQAQSTAYRNNLLGTVNSQIAKYSVDPTENDPDILGPTEAYRGEAERATRMNRESMAERAGAQGLPTGSLDAAVETGNEDLGKAVGGYKANLLSNKFGQYATGLSDAVKTGAGILDSGVSSDLQNRVSTLSAAEAANRDFAQNNQFYDNLGVSAADNTSSLQQILYSFLLSGGGG